VTVAALLAHRNAERQLRYHMVGYLNAGGEARILVELLFVSIAVLGFPVAIHGIALVRDIFTERGIDFARIAPRVDDGSTALRAGHEAMARMLGDAAAPTLASWSELDTVFANWSVAFEYGEIFNRDALDARTRELAIVIMLASAGNRATALERHVEAALRAGVQHTELTEAFMQLAVYAGFPTALNAITTRQRGVQARRAVDQRRERADLARGRRAARGAPRTRPRRHGPHLTRRRHHGHRGLRRYRARHRSRHRRTRLRRCLRA
jgi:4-carboxymuconolactone decarboxylase